MCEVNKLPFNVCLRQSLAVIIGSSKGVEKPVRRVFEQRAVTRPRPGKQSLRTCGIVPVDCFYENVGLHFSVDMDTMAKSARW